MYALHAQGQAPNHFRNGRHSDTRDPHLVFERGTLLDCARVWSNEEAREVAEQDLKRLNRHGGYLARRMRGCEVHREADSPK